VADPEQVKQHLASLENQANGVRPNTGRRNNFFAAASGGFQGGKLDRMTDDWTPGNLSPNAIHRLDGALLRERARDLVINDPLAKSGVDAYIANVIECGITPKPGFQDQDRRRAWLEEWDRWGGVKGRYRSADVTEQQTIYELLALWLEEVIVGGGCLLRRRTLRRNNRRRISAAIELIPEERFCDDRDTFIMSRNSKKSTNNITRGVEVDGNGRAVAYWIKPTHPNDSLVGQSLAGADPVRIPADECEYAFFRRRIGQTRGHTMFSAAIVWLWKLGYFTDNELVASMIKSCYAVAVKSDGDEDFATLKDEDTSTTGDIWSNQLEKITPGMIGRLRPGDSIEGVGPNSPGGDSTPWLMLIQRSIAVAMNQSYEETVRDYSQGNFSSTRAAANSDQKRYRPMQKFAIAHCLAPTYEHFVQSAVLAGRDTFPSPAEFVANADEFLSVTWRTPGWVSVNPGEDAKADEINLRIGTTTRDAINARRGQDWEATMEQLARENEQAEAGGVDVSPQRPGAIAESGSEEDQDDPDSAAKKKEAADGK
jgi:lambda family phage portal protein